MDFVTSLAAACQHGLATFANGPVGVPLSLFATGLAGSAVHCAGMCGPFVIGQVVADADSSRSYGEWRRLRGAALAPYHLGRLTTYTMLGALAGSATGIFSQSPAFAWLSAALLAAAAIVMASQAFGLALATAPAFAGPLGRLAAPLSSARTPLSRYGLGVALGFLPCGLVYGALAAAGGSGSMLSGALAMAAFGLGTAPALVAVGWGGMLLRRRLREVAGWLAAPLLLANALLMLVLASSRLQAL